MVAYRYLLLTLISVASVSCADTKDGKIMDALGDYAETCIEPYHGNMEIAGVCRSDTISSYHITGTFDLLLRDAAWLMSESQEEEMLSLMAFFEHNDIFIVQHEVKAVMEYEDGTAFERSIYVIEVNGEYTVQGYPLRGEQVPVEVIKAARLIDDMNIKIIETTNEIRKAQEILSDK